jgi:hypothetical protein
MTIDLERLAVDAEYWDEVAPEGATHFMYSEKFVKWVDGVELSFYVSSERKWKKSFCSWSLQQYIDCGNYMIAKPKSQPTDTQPAESGAQISVKWGGMPIQAQYSAILPDSTLVFYRKDSCGTWQIWGFHSKQWLFDGYANDAGKPPYDLKAIRSQAEQEREAVISAALDGCGYDKDCFAIAGSPESMDLLNELYDLGFLSMPTKMFPHKARGES